MTRNKDFFFFLHKIICNILSWLQFNLKSLSYSTDAHGFGSAMTKMIKVDFCFNCCFFLLFLGLVHFLFVLVFFLKLPNHTFKKMLTVFILPVSLGYYDCLSHVRKGYCDRLSGCVSGGVCKVIPVISLSWM